MTDEVASGTRDETRSNGKRVLEVPHLLRKKLGQAYEIIHGNRMGEFGAAILIVLLLLAFVGPYVAPYDPMERHLNEDGGSARLEAPSADHPLGTTLYGRDVLSQVLVGAQTALLVGFLTGTIIITLGTTVGVVAGYYGGMVDDALMRVVDIVYGIPMLPFAIVALTMLEKSILWIILIIGLIYWRTTARVIRGEVLKIREEEFLQKAKTTGASNPRIIVKQVLPNVLPISLLYFAFGVGYAIIYAASIAFLGFGDPNRISWGRMIFAAWNNNAIFAQPFWALAPGIMIVLAVSSVYFVGQTYEQVANPRLQER